VEPLSSQSNLALFIFECRPNGCTDVSELDGGDCARPVFPDPNDLMHFKVVVTPDSGHWAGCQYIFDFEVPDMYPHDPPKVKCTNKVRVYRLSYLLFVNVVGFNPWLLVCLFVYIHDTRLT
jgi:hypothetical protein